MFAMFVQRLCLVMLLAFSGSLVAQEEATTEKKTEMKPQQVDPELDQLLNELEMKANNIRAMSANVVWAKENDLRGDLQKRYGSLIYLSGPPAKFAVTFKTLLIDTGAARPQKIDQNRSYVYDGVWLVERITDKKQFIKRQIAPLPDPNKAEAADQKPAVDALAEGRGPFAVPLKFNRKSLSERFYISRVNEKTKADAPKLLQGAVQLKFIPKPPRQVDFQEMHIWYSMMTKLPVRVMTKDKASSSTFDVWSPKLNDQIKTSLLSTITTDPPKEKGWQVEVEKMKK